MMKRANWMHLMSLASGIMLMVAGGIFGRMAALQEAARLAGERAAIAEVFLGISGMAMAVFAGLMFVLMFHAEDDSS